jgi:hypothetical protein
VRDRAAGRGQTVRRPCARGRRPVPSPGRLLYSNALKAAGYVITHDEQDAADSEVVWAHATKTGQVALAKRSPAIGVCGLQLITGTGTLDEHDHAVRRDRQAGWDLQRGLGVPRYELGSRRVGARCRTLGVDGVPWGLNPQHNRKQPSGSQSVSWCARGGRAAVASPLSRRARVVPGTAGRSG